MQSLFEYGRIMNSYRMKIKFEKVLDLLLTEKGEGILYGDESAKLVCNAGFAKGKSGLSHEKFHFSAESPNLREFSLENSQDLILEKF